MKYILPLLFIFLIPVPVFAQDGNSSTQVHVETSGGTTKTDISVESNGVKKEIHTTNPGTIDVKIENGKTTETQSSTSASPIPTISITIPKTPRLTPNIRKPKVHAIMPDFFSQLRQFFSSLFR